MTRTREPVDPLDVLRVASSHGLPGAELPAAAAEMELRVTDEVMTLASRHRVQGLLRSAVDAEVVLADGQMIAAVHTSHDEAMARCRTALVAARQALAVLGSAGVEARVLKGIATSRLDHADSTQRVFGDADLLIRRTDYIAAMAALIDADFTRALPAVRNSWERRFGKAVVLAAPAGGELDVHLAITGGYFGARIDHDRLWSERSAPVDVAGVEAYGLDAEGRLLHACAHAVLGGGSGLRTLRDIAQLVLVTGADWQSVIDTARREGCDLVIAGAVRATWTELGLDHEHPLLRWAARYVPDHAQQRAFAGYTAAFEQGWAPEGLGVLAALPPIDRVRYIAGLCLPSRASLRARDRSWPEHLRLGVAALRNRS